MGEFIRLTAATLLGALISFGTTYFFERRKEDRAKKAEEQQRRRQLQQATRLVLEELQTNSELLWGATHGRIWSNPVDDLDQHVWLEYRGTLALVVEDQFNWEMVTRAEVRIGDLNRRLGIIRKQELSILKSDGSIVDEWVSFIKRITADVDKGVNALAGFLDG